MTSPLKLTPERIAGLRELDAKATKGPWRVNLSPEDPTYSDCVLGGEDGQDEVFDKGCHGRFADLGYAAESRTALPDALSDLATQAATIEEMRDLIRGLHASRLNTGMPCFGCNSFECLGAPACSIAALIGGGS